MAPLSWPYIALIVEVERPLTSPNVASEEICGGEALARVDRE
jgi:hypothetical protein